MRVLLVVCSRSYQMGIFPDVWYLCLSREYNPLIMIGEPFSNWSFNSRVCVSACRFLTIHMPRDAVSQRTGINRSGAKMKTTRSSSRYLTMALIILLVSSPSFGEEPAEKSEATQLEEIVVTGARVETEVQTIPQTVNVISEEEVEKVKYRNAADLLKRIPGVFTQNLNGEDELTSIRVPTHFSNPYTLLLRDGLPATGYGDSAGGLLREIDNSSVQSIEVIKGPASALYGSNAIGGVINIITKPPPPDPFFKLWGEYGEWNQWRGSISGGGQAGPVGIITDLFFIDAEEWREHSQHKKLAGTLRSQYATSDSSLLDFDLQYINIDNDTAGSLAEEDFKENWRQSYMTFTYTELEKIAPSLTYTLDTAAGEFKTALLLRSIDHEVNPNYGIRYNSRTRSYTSYLSKIDSLDFDAQLLYSRNFKPLSSRLVGGIDFERGASGIDTYDLDVTRDPVTKKYTDYTVTGLGGSYDVTTYANAPYLQLLSSPFSRFNVTLGGRYDSVRYEVDDKLDTGMDGDKDFSHFSPKVGATYDIFDNFNLFAAYSQGFVVPTINQIFTGRGANRDLVPEKADNIETGFRSAYWQNKVRFDLSLYYMEIDDKIIVQTVDPVTSAIEYQNVGKTSHTGLETTITLLPLNWMQFALAYTYARNTYEDFNDPVTGIDYSGNTMPLAPENRLNARLGIIPINRMLLELEMDFQDQYYVDDANTDTYDRPSLFNFRATYNWKSWSIWVHVLNLTDEKYASRVTARNGISSFFPGAPRSVFVGLSYQWGSR